MSLRISEMSKGLLYRDKYDSHTLFEIDREPISHFNTFTESGRWLVNVDYNFKFIETISIDSDTTMLLDKIEASANERLLFVLAKCGKD